MGIIFLVSAFAVITVFTVVAKLNLIFATLLMIAIMAVCFVLAERS